MNKFINRDFNLGFFGGTLLFSLLNYVSYVLSEEQATHTYDRFGFGFPFFIYDYNSYVAREGIDEIGLMFSILTALIVSSFIGLIFKFTISRNSSPQLA
jgi:hypothetical protein